MDSFINGNDFYSSYDFNNTVKLIVLPSQRHFSG